MAEFKISYFDFDGGRGEDCRLALHAGGADFEDDRIQIAQWSEMKASTPWGAMPTLEPKGGKIGQSNAILAFIGRSTGQHPTDPWEAARHESVLAAVEEMRGAIEYVMKEKDPEKRKTVREEMAAGILQRYGANFESQIGDGPFLAGDKLNVADLKLFVACRWLCGNVIDHVPADVFDGFPKLLTLCDAVKAHPAVVSWYANR